MRVLFPFFKRSFGGSDKSAIEIMKILLEAGYEVRAFLQQPNSPLEKELSEIGVKATKANSGWCFLGRGLDFFATPYWVLRFCLYLIFNKIDVVHTNDKQSHFNWVLVCCVCNVSHIWHQRTLLRLNRYRSFLLRLATQVVGVSGYCFSYVDLSFLKRKPLIINHAVEFSGVKACSKAADDRVKIGFFGGLRSEKRPFLFLQLAQCLVALGGEDKFVFEVYGGITDISIHDFEQAISSAGMSEHVSFRGFVENPIECMAGCDFVVSMWPQEAYGRVSIEAALAGSVPIAANVAGYAEVIEHGISGLLVDDYESPTAYAEAILEFLGRDPEWLREFKLGSQEYVRKRFSYIAYVNNIVKLYSLAER